jgi:RNA polymerase sigma-70 factor (ECF subfamily)
VERVLVRNDAPTDELDDICQGIFLGLVEADARALRCFGWRSSLKSWLWVVAASKAVDHLRARRAAASVDESRLAARISEADGAPVERVRSAMDSLGPRDRLLIQLALVHDQSYRQIAESLGISENAVGPALSRALARLKESFSRLAK